MMTSIYVCLSSAFWRGTVRCVIRQYCPIDMKVSVLNRNIEAGTKCPLDNRVMHTSSGLHSRYLCPQGYLCELSSPRPVMFRPSHRGIESFIVYLHFREQLYCKNALVKKRPSTSTRNQTGLGRVGSELSEL